MDKSTISMAIFNSYVKLPEGKLYSRNHGWNLLELENDPGNAPIGYVSEEFYGIVTCMPVSNRSTGNHKTSWWNDISQKFTRRSGGSGTNSIWLKAYSSDFCFTMTLTCTPVTPGAWSLCSFQGPDFWRFRQFWRPSIFLMLFSSKRLDPRLLVSADLVWRCFELCCMTLSFPKCGWQFNSSPS